MKAEKKGPLEGIKVLDLSAVFPGPLAAMHLGDLGAKVIKVEHPKIGDWGRKLGPAFKPKSGHGQRVMDSGMFYMCNRNKHSITVNIMKKEGRKIIHQLLPAVDIIIESNKPGILHKLGLDYETLKHNYPQLIYCHISMFGYKGPYSTKMGHDGNCLAYSGLLNLNLNNKGKPVLPGYQIADTGGSYIGLSSILAALYYREKHKTGQFIDVSLLDCSFSFQSIPLGFYQSGEQQIGGKTALSGNLPNYNIYRCKDNKYIIFAPLEKQNFKTFLELVNKVKWFDIIEKNNKRGIKLLAKLFLSKNRNEWEDIIQHPLLCLSPVNTFEEALNDKHLTTRDMIIKMEDEHLGDIIMIGAPFRLSESPCTYRERPPEKGEHTKEYLKQLGYSYEEISQLKAKRIV